MSMDEYRFGYDFFAVGHGLFSAGFLARVGRSDDFNWIFDCGTLSKRNFLQRELKHYEQWYGVERINLFCISHFDEDHINGAKELLTRRRVDRLVMPYFPLADRMLIALETPGLSDEHLGFLIDPVGYLRGIAGDNLGEVILIAGGESSGEDGFFDEGDFNPDGDDQFRFQYPDTKLREQPDGADMHGTIGDSVNNTARVLGHQKPFRIGATWEFLFYNEHRPDATVQALRDDVVDIINKHRQTDGTFAGNSLLRDLKTLYAKQFGPTAIEKNAISLVVYSGPVKHPRLHRSELYAGVIPVGFDEPPWGLLYRYSFRRHRHRRVSIGYFGDFPLTSPAKITSIRNHFGQRRWNAMEVVQIPHHGSDLSWYTGASAEFLHSASVISSRRCSKNHPSQSVLDDLSTHGVILVNEYQRASFAGQIFIEEAESA